MKLSKIETLITYPTLSDDRWSEIKPFLFVRLTTDTGIEGWGEAFTLPLRESGIAEFIHKLSSIINSMDNLLPSTFNYKVKEISNKHRGIDFSAATNAIEISLWDIQGKLKNKPLSHLLSNKIKDKIPVYANTWSEKSPSIKALSERAVQLLDEGYGGIKIYPLQNRTIEEAAECVSSIRNSIGTKIPLMLDLACPDDLNLAIRLAQLVTKFQPYWYEEPVDGEDIQSLIEIKKLTELRVVTGEKQFEIPHFKQLLKESAADIFNPDIAAVGGILDMVAISKLSSKKNVKISPHCWNSMSIAASAMLHFCAANDNTDMAEIYPEYLPHAKRFSDISFIINEGHATLNNKPGLGTEINVSSLSAICSDYKETTI